MLTRHTYRLIISAFMVSHSR